MASLRECMMWLSILALLPTTLKWVRKACATGLLFSTFYGLRTSQPATCYIAKKLFRCLFSLTQLHPQCTLRGRGDRRFGIKTQVEGRRRPSDKCPPQHLPYYPECRGQPKRTNVRPLLHFAIGLKWREGAVTNRMPGTRFPQYHVS